MEKQVFSGKYQIEEEVARGGMGIVYRGRDLKLNCLIAIKVLHGHLSGDDSFAKRFIQEAQRMARLAHDNIVRVLALDEEDGKSYIVMEYFPGPTLRTVLRGQPRLPVRQAVGIARQLARALEYAHAQGIIHRDIKPANIMVGADGKAKLVDFGIAAALDESSLTATGQVIGTPEYMAPEQARGEAVGRSDLYSLGIVLYEMLVGRTPYHGVPKTAILGKLMHDGDEVALNFPGDTPPMLQDIVHALTRRDPSARTPDAATLARQLTKIMEAIDASPDISEDDATIPVPVPNGGIDKTDVVPPHKPEDHAIGSGRVNRWWSVAGSLVGATLLLLLSAIYIWWPPQTRDDSQQEAKGRSSADNRKAALDQLLQSFALAYERHDLEAIVRMSDMSNSRLTTVRLMFDHYSTITAHIEDTTMTDEGATALLVITDLIDAKGARMTPDSILRRTKLRIKKEGDIWTKIVW